MELLVGFIAFDLIVYLLLRLVFRPSGKPATTTDDDVSLSARYTAQPRMMTPIHHIGHRGLFHRPMAWPRTRVRPQDPARRW